MQGRARELGFKIIARGISISIKNEQVKMRFFLNEIGQYFKDSYIPLLRFHGKSIILVSIIRVNCF